MKNQIRPISTKLGRQMTANVVKLPKCQFEMRNRFRVMAVLRWKGKHVHLKLGR